MATNNWKWPLPAPYGEKYITSNYGYRTAPIEGATSNHKGIDIGAPLGVPVTAIGSGTIISYGTASGYGYWVRIDHGDNIVSIYGHVKLLSSGIKVGSQVNIGDHIANVGNEGTSTGPHLHLQIEVNGEPVDPMRYVSPDKITIIDSNSESSSVSDSDDDSEDYIINASGITTGVRASESSKQPLHAFINIYIGDNLLPLASNPAKPNSIQSFTYNRLQDAGETASLTLFDDNWEEIEYTLANNFEHIYIEYGYPGTGLKSRLIKHRLSQYDAIFNFTGTLLTVESISEGVYNNLKQRTIALDTKNPTEAVKKICLAIGCVVREENFDKSSDIVSDNPFNLIEDYPITYILDYILPQAAEENEEIFSFYIDGDNVAYFKREGYDDVNTKDMRTYIYQKGYDSAVVSLEFSLGGVFGGSGDFKLATNYRSTILDTSSRQQTTANASKSSVITSASGDYIHTRSDQSNPIIDAAGYTPQQVKNRLYYYMKHTWATGYKATMRIIGDPTIELNELIRVINMTESGNLHYTSGVYRINSITDTIQGGIFYTDLELIREAVYNIDGLELINPTTLIR